MGSTLATAVLAEAVPITIAGPAVSTYDADGVVTRTLPTAIAALATIQPANGRNLIDLPEGVIKDATLVGWTTSPIDIDHTVVYASVAYRVVRAMARPADGFTKFALHVW